MSIEAMKQALEALKVEDLACLYEKEPTPEHIANAITALCQAIARAEHLEAEKREPVGHLLMGPEQEFVTTVAAGDLPINVWHSVYTHPPVPQGHEPKREWVGLTDDEAQALRADCINTPIELQNIEYGWAINYARAIEAKLKEKNYNDCQRLA